ncbi:TetR/AcrR family transcriptional regulator [Sphingobium aquiterrae]|uniref:TetR/AcrR family transcriptional regulator n=1 Tax=Sphingobium aquiterrae TaxID=2038656 RepID=UPI00301A556C|tara:strand:- start:2587 stop:3255 length:669 start_codon:yes stop_codon:yes gene_type:complete
MARKRQFDHEEALDIATRAFWLTGYEGTSIADLESAIGVSKPSIYRVFGSKEQLFRQAVDCFAERYAGFFLDALEEATAINVLRHLIVEVIRSVTGSDTPPGSLLAHGAMACVRENEEIRAYVLRRRGKFERLLVQRLIRARSEGEFAQEIDCRLVARYVIALCDGIALQAKSGTGRSALAGIQDIALAGICCALGVASAEHLPTGHAVGVDARDRDGRSQK